MEENISRSLPDHLSIFSAEALAIDVAIKRANEPTVIYTDSASVLTALESGTKHPIVQNIIYQKNLKNVTMVWIPSHVGIQGNEEADRLANLGRNEGRYAINIPKADALKWIKRMLKLQHERNWNNQLNIKLREIKSTTEKWKDMNNKKEQKVLTRLRNGHTRMTHKHLMEGTETPVCDACGVQLTVKHIIMECLKYNDRRQVLPEGSLAEKLENVRSKEKKVIQFLKQCNLFSEI
ncbi:uncharacterized protein LOC129741762 [Uranotaenia lowii]|uniref:uncharacterized protein LOC129741762 n=1 Tax=Uranotaenia lowii TaxID=190385 RepID=UPI0024799130|nr:uncharacterized protein LOC129741762 [Uranotaenia lowii]